MMDQDQIYADGVGNYSTDFFTDRAKAIINHHANNERPFFMWLSYTAPHTPLQVRPLTVKIHACACALHIYNHF